MNRNEFEEQMKDKLQEQQFAPREDLWLKLKADLPQNKIETKKAIFFAPIKMAAAAAIIISMGITTFYIFKGNKQDAQTPSVAKQHSLPKPETLPPAIPVQQPVFATQSQTKSSQHIAVQKTQQPVEPQPGDNHIVLPSEKPHDIIKPQKNDINIANNNAANSNQQKQQEPNIFIKDPYYANSSKPGTDKAIHVGMVANVGSSTISNVAYQVGVVGQSNLNQTFFVEAGLTVASNTVSTSSNYSFPNVSVSNDGNMTSAITGTTDVTADYARNVISVGFTPAIGIKATKQLSFSTGGSVYRNLNPSLTLNNKSDIDPTAFSNKIINTTETVANWDLGLNCNASYKVTKNLSLNVNYRKGLTDYLQQNNKQIKNSGVQLGLKFLFNKQ